MDNKYIFFCTVFTCFLPHHNICLYSVSFSSFPIMLKIITSVFSLKSFHRYLHQRSLWVVCWVGPEDTLDSVWGIKDRESGMNCYCFSAFWVYSGNSNPYSLHPEESYIAQSMLLKMKSRWDKMSQVLTYSKGVPGELLSCRISAPTPIKHSWTGNQGYLTITGSCVGTEVCRTVAPDEYGWRSLTQSMEMYNKSG